MNSWLATPMIGTLPIWGFASLADAALKGTCLLVIAMIASVLFRRRRSAVRHLVWVTMFALLLTLPALTTFLPGWQVLPSWLRLPVADTTQTSFAALQPERESALPGLPAIPRETRAPRTPGFSAVPDRSATVEPSADLSKPISEMPLEPSINIQSVAFEAESTRHPPLATLSASHGGWLNTRTRHRIVLVWLLGVLLFAVRLVASAGLLFQRERRARVLTGGPLFNKFEHLCGELGLKRPPRLLVGDKRALPMAWGVGRSRVLVPQGIEDWPASQQRAVLLHEAGHVARRDPLWQLVVELAKATYWFHPLVWLAAWRVHVERELACDDLVLNRGIVAKDYARHLLDVVSGRRLGRIRADVGVAMASAKRLEGRVRSILAENQDRRPLSRRVLWMGIVACLIVGLPLAMMRAAEVQQKAGDDTNSTAASEEKPKTDRSAATNKAAVKGEGTNKDVTRRVRELIYLLRQHRVFQRNDEWAGTIRELVTIGKPAVPELVAELDRTNRDLTLRALGFTLRAIGEPQAVPALIRAIPKLLRRPGSDCGLSIRDPELRAFMKKHQRDPDDDDESVTYGRPVNEILDALSKITGHHEPQDQENDKLRHHFSGGTKEQQAAKERMFEQRTTHWESWWSRHWRKFATKEELQAVKIAKRDRDLVEEAGLARFGPLFPTGKFVRLGPIREVLLELGVYINAKSHIDFDTGRVFQYLEGIERERLAKPEDFNARTLTWYVRMGIDARCRGSISGLDLHLWFIENSRWDTLEQEIRSGKPLKLGRETTDNLIPIGRHRSDFKPDRVGTFLFTTREGGRGVVQVFPRAADSDARKLRYRMWIDSDAKRRKPVGTTITLQTPGRGKLFLLNLGTGIPISPPDTVMPATISSKTSLYRNEKIANWCREQGVDIGVRESSVRSGFGALPGAGPKKIVALVGMGMERRRVLPKSFETMSADDVRAILNRFRANKSGLTWMSPWPELAHQPDTFVIKTRDGRVGLLQIVKTGEDLRSITIRYRMFPTAKAGDKAAKDGQP